MERKVFNKITKEIFLEHGFIKKKSYYILMLEDITFVVRFQSWRDVKSFDLTNISLNAFYDEATPIEKRWDNVIEIKLEHDFNAKGYHRHEILYETYSEDEYRNLLTNMLHFYFDPFKDNALKYLKLKLEKNPYFFQLNDKARRFCLES